MELHWVSFLVITILMSNSAPCFCDTSNDIDSNKRGISLGYPNEIQPYKLKDIDANNLELYSPTRHIARNYDGVQGLRERRRKYKLLRQQLKQDAEKLRKLKATVRKVLPPLLRILRDDRDDDDSEEDGSSRYDV